MLCCTNTVGDVNMPNKGLQPFFVKKQPSSGPLLTALAPPPPTPPLIPQSDDVTEESGLSARRLACTIFQFIFRAARFCSR